MAMVYDHSDGGRELCMVRIRTRWPPSGGLVSTSKTILSLAVGARSKPGDGQQNVLDAR